MKPRASAPRTSAGSRGRAQSASWLIVSAKYTGSAMSGIRSLNTTPSVGKSGTSRMRSRRSISARPLRCPAKLAHEQQVRELLRYTREGLEILERVPAALRVPCAKPWSDELLDERGLPSGTGQERSQVAGVDAVARKTRARRGDVRLALCVKPLPALRARDEQSELLELPYEVRRDGRPIAELGLVDLVLVPEDT